MSPKTTPSAPRASGSHPLAVWPGFSVTQQGSSHWPRITRVIRPGIRRRPRDPQSGHAVVLAPGPTFAAGRSCEGPSTSGGCPARPATGFGSSSALQPSTRGSCFLHTTVPAGVTTRRSADVVRARCDPATWVWDCHLTVGPPVDEVPVRLHGERRDGIALLVGPGVGEACVAGHDAVRGHQRRPRTGLPDNVARARRHDQVAIAGEGEPGRAAVGGAGVPQQHVPARAQGEITLARESQARGVGVALVQAGGVVPEPRARRVRRPAPGPAQPDGLVDPDEIGNTPGSNSPLTSRFVAVRAVSVWHAARDACGVAAAAALAGAAGPLTAIARAAHAARRCRNIDFPRSWPAPRRHPRRRRYRSTDLLAGGFRGRKSIAMSTCFPSLERVAAPPSRATGTGRRATTSPLVVSAGANRPQGGFFPGAHRGCRRVLALRPRRTGRDRCGARHERRPPPRCRQLPPREPVLW